MIGVHVCTNTSSAIFYFNTTCSLPVIAKVFRSADTEETGVVDVEVVPALGAKILGTGVKESDMQLIRYKAELKGGGEGKRWGGREGGMGERTRRICWEVASPVPRLLA